MSETFQSERHSNYSARKCALVVSMLGLAAVLSLPFDVQFAEFFLSDPFPGELRILIHKAEVFGHGYGILGITLTIYLLDEARRRKLPRLLAAAFGAGMICNLFKLTIHRIRPCHFSFAPDSPTFLGFSFQNANAFGDMFDSAFHSFPSAHTATSVAFALVLGRVYPKGNWWFLTLAMLVAAGRFDGGAHWVSDTFVGGMIGFLTAFVLLGENRTSRWFHRLESVTQAPGPRLARETTEHRTAA